MCEKAPPERSHRVQPAVFMTGSRPRVQALLYTRKLCYRKDDRAMRAILVDREPLRRYGHSKLSKMAAAAILNLFESKMDQPLDPLSPKTPPYNQT